jgi:UDPglucose--hexose-1-phosphate uridylyltransferase
MTALPTSLPADQLLSLVGGRPIIKRERVLADGRQLIYFDDADSTLDPDRSADTRVLDARLSTPTMRRDVLTGEWVTIASARNSRVVLPPSDTDPLAPQTPGNPSEVPSNYDVAVFENRSPAFGPDLADSLGIEPTSAPDALQPDVLQGERAAVGRCEVVSFSPDSEGSLASQSTSRVRTVIEAWADRTRVLSAMPGVEQVFPFENRGAEVGVTLLHPHGQIYAYPFVPPRTRALIRMLDDYGPGFFADILDRERQDERVVLEGEHWSAFVPFAARWPIEVHILPHRHVPDLAATSEAERDELAILYPRLLRGIDALYETPTPYIAGWHQAPVAERRDEIRLMLQITSPRRSAEHLKFLAGSEAIMGAFIGDVLPEAFSHRLRETIPAH